jgi:hypothetical protein
MLEVLRLHRNFNDTWRAKRVIKKADEKGVTEYLEGLEKSNIRHKARRRKGGSKRRAQSTSPKE